MARYFIGGVANITLYDGNDIILKSTTLSDSSMELSVDKQEVRGGQGAKLYGQYFHTSQLQLTLTDIMFSLDYVALNTGSVKNIGGVAYGSETITLGASGAGSITGTAIPFNTTYVAWVRPQGGDNYTTVTLDSTTHKNFTYAAGAEGDVVCVSYPISSSGQYISIPATIIPSTVHAVMEANLYNGGGSTNDVNTATLAGTAIIDIPRLQLTGAQTISMTSTGVSTTPLTGMALAVDSGTCSDDAVYGTFTTNLTGENWYDNMTMISFNDQTISLATNGTAQIITYAIAPATAPYTVPVADLTFAGGDQAIATVDATGKVTAVGTGNCIITVTAKNKASLNGIVQVTVA